VALNEHDAVRSLMVYSSYRPLLILWRSGEATTGGAKRRYGSPVVGRVPVAFLNPPRLAWSICCTSSSIVGNKSPNRKGNSAAAHDILHLSVATRSRS
jgi:hypothetical protein